MKERLDYIDRAKGILIFLVIIGHIWQRGVVYNFIYAFHMLAFFVISGMLFRYTQPYKKSFLSFLLSKIYSYGIPFVFIEILGCLSDIIRHGISLNVKGYMYNTLTLSFNDPNLWFLFTLFCIEILFCAIYKGFKKNAIVLLTGLVLLAASLFVPKGNNYYASVRRVCYYAIFFAVGFYCFEIIKKRNRLMVLLALPIVLAVSLVFGKRENPGMSIENIAFLITAFLGTYGIIHIGKIDIGKIDYPQKVKNWLEWAGRNTLIIYGTHHFYYIIIGTLLGITDYGTTPVWAGLVMLLGVILLEIPTVYIINRWLPFLAGKHYNRKEKEA